MRRSFLMPGSKDSFSRQSGYNRHGLLRRAIEVGNVVKETKNKENELAEQIYNVLEHLNNIPELSSSTQHKPPKP